jgi:hypothetical protein
MCRHTYLIRLTACKINHGLSTEAGGHKDYDATLKNYIRLPIQDKIDVVDLI